MLWVLIEQELNTLFVYVLTQSFIPHRTNKNKNHRKIKAKYRSHYQYFQLCDIPDIQEMILQIDTRQILPRVEIIQTRILK